mmetsp:Transcript_35611/g.91561  ORF Transcript_35611/g.91561 Transcript_35611/m.91561 type:complete len:409 (+) Transcript_35611:117-1343(+)
MGMDAAAALGAKLKERSVLWAIDRSNSQLVRMKASEEEIRERFKYLEAIPELASFTKEDKEKLSGAMDTMALTQGQELVSEGVLGFTLYILVNGTVAVRGQGIAERMVEAGSPDGSTHYFGVQALLGSKQSPTETVAVTSPTALALVMASSEFNKIWDRLMEAKPSPAFTRYATSATKQAPLLDDAADCEGAETSTISVASGIEVTTEEPAVLASSTKASESAARMESADASTRAGDDSVAGCLPTSVCALTEKQPTTNAVVRTLAETTQEGSGAAKLPAAEPAAAGKVASPPTAKALPTLLLPCVGTWAQKPVQVTTKAAMVAGSLHVVSDAAAEKVSNKVEEAIIAPTLPAIVKEGRWSSLPSVGTWMAASLRPAALQKVRVFGLEGCAHANAPAGHGEQGNCQAA